MSQTIWTRCGGEASFRRLRFRAWRVVEGQHVIATRKLVDSVDEHAVLEAMIDAVKPPLPEGSEFTGLHYLLTTPFRYPPLRHGSRFGGRFERGLWYGSLTTETALAETAFYRLLLLEGTRARFDVVTSEHSAFRVRLESSRAIDLAQLPKRRVAPLSDRLSYRASQTFGQELRAAGGELLRFPSARDPGRGLNVAVWTPRVFREAQPHRSQTWTAQVMRAAVVFYRQDLSGAVQLEFARELFGSGERLPHPSSSG